MEERNVGDRFRLEEVKAVTKDRVLTTNPWPASGSLSTELWRLLHDTDSLTLTRLVDS